MQYLRCENCGYVKTEANEDENWKWVRFYKRHSKLLCDECVDKINGTWNMEVYLDDSNRLKVRYPYKTSKD